MTKYLRFLPVLLSLLLLMGCGAIPAPTVTPPPPTEAPVSGMITIGDISDEPTEIIETHQPIADYIGSRLNMAGEVKVAPDIDTMVEWVKTGEVDLYFDSPYPALIVSNGSGAQPLLRRWKEGIGEYTSIIFTVSENNLESLDDLKGKMIAFDEPYSTSGYMLPLAYLLEAGYQTAEKTSTDAPVANDEVGYLFSGDDENSVQWVISGRVDAAVVDSGAFASIPEESRSQLRVLAETEALPRHVLVISPTVNAETREAVRTVLLEMDESEEGKAVLAQFEETAQFDEFPGGAETALSRMQELFDLVSQHDD
jgi:phosphonate transport system substrate-binding protein